MSNNLDLTQLASNSVDFTVLVNTVTGELDAAIGELLTIDFSSDNQTVTATQFRRNFEFRSSNLSVARTLTVQAIRRFFFVNNTDGTATLSVVLGSTTIEIEAGGNGLFRTDGTADGLIQTAGGAGGASAFTALSDTPGDYTGQGLLNVRVNAAETGLEFGAAVTLAAKPSRRGAFVSLSANQSIPNNSGTVLVFATRNYDTTHQPIDAGESQRFWLGANKTFIDGDVTTGTDVVAESAHGFTTGEGPVRLTSSGTLPAGLAVDTNYWIITVDINNIAFATSRANALADTRVDITAAAGGGTHTIETADKLVVPAGVSAVRVSGSCHWASASNGIRAPAIVRNTDFGLIGRTEDKYVAGGTGTDNVQPMSSPVIPVSEGDFFQLNVFQNSGGAVNVLADSGTSFSIEAVEFEENTSIAEDVSGEVGGVPATSTVLIRRVFTRSVEFPAGLPFSQGYAGTAPNAETDFDIQRNGVSIGTMRFANGANTATFIAASDTTFSAGDRLEVISPANLNTLANLTYTLVGNRNV